MHPARVTIDSRLNGILRRVIACRACFDKHSYAVQNKNCRDRYFNNRTFLIS